MSPPIMSRFDLFFVVTDECNEAADWNIARHIVNFHRFDDEEEQGEFGQEKLLRFLKWARSLQPKVPSEI